MEYNSNPKALNLDILEEDTSGRKVTLGFKCSPQLKLQLATEAQEKGYSLSEYVESIMETYTTQSGVLEKLNLQANELQKIVDMYEKNQIVQTIFDEYKGKTISIKGKGNLKIESAHDVIRVIFHSFKFEKK